MFKVLILALVFSAVKCELRPILTRRGIVGGIDLKKSHPYTHQVSLRLGGEHICGGSIIHNRVIVTAAHCICKTTINFFSVVAGIANEKDVGQTLLPKKIRIHANYSENTLCNDIAVIMTHKEIVFNEHVQPIPLHDNYFEGGKECIATGWGYIRHEGPHSMDLRELKTVSLSNAECNRRQKGLRPEIDAHKQICILRGVGKGVCMGDSGGPLTADGKLVGLASWIRGKCASGNPDVYIRLSGYVDWINAAIDSFMCII